MPRFLTICLALLTCISLSNCGSDGADAGANQEVVQTEVITPDVEAEPLTPVANREEVVNDVPEHSVESLPYTPEPNKEFGIGEEEEQPVNEKPKASIVPAPNKTSAPAVSAQKNTTEVGDSEIDIEEEPSVDHSAFESLLQKYVSADGRVDYQGFSKDKAALQAYLDDLSANVPAKSLPRNERLAYWINAYNAYTIKLIVDNLPLESIRDLGKPWDNKWIELGGKTYSLNNIEHDLIRPEFNEPRIHFALVCAAKSCPPLANRAFTPENVNSLLESRTRKFIRDDKFNVTHEETVRVSPLFDWYASDFGDVRAYLNKYLQRSIPEGIPINFMEYDWSLNN